MSPMWAASSTAVRGPALRILRLDMVAYFRNGAAVHAVRRATAQRQSSVSAAGPRQAQSGGRPKAAEMSVSQRQAKWPSGLTCQCAIRTRRGHPVGRCRTGADALSNPTGVVAGTARARKASILRMAVMAITSGSSGCSNPGWPGRRALAHKRVGPHGDMRNPGHDPARQSRHGRQQTPTVALRGLAVRSRFHVVLCWLNRSRR